MRIEVKGRNTPVSEELREQVERRFAKVGKQVSELAVLEVDVCVERNPGSPELHVVSAALLLKGTTLRARDASRDAGHALGLVADEMGRQVKRHRDKRRNRRDGRAATPVPLVPPDAAGEGLAAS